MAGKLIGTLEVTDSDCIHCVLTPVLKAWLTRHASAVEPVMCSKIVGDLTQVIGEFMVGGGCPPDMFPEYVTFVKTCLEGYLRQRGMSS